MVAYMESFVQFSSRLLNYDGLYLHSSAIEWEGKAYLFSGPSGMGKSTHTRLWQSIYPAAQVFNDDKPALRYLDGQWFAYGTPWCGKDGININMKVPLGGICFLRRGEANSIRRLTPLEATMRIVSQTTRKFKTEERLDLLLSHVEKLVAMIPIYELHCLPDADAARLSSETMRRGAKENNL
jgi:energy-coupling factor transporter ATP-binding protein EcfA2